ncbi:hypothetical protein [Dactylosporangium sp. NPDC050588]|uniref:hypothetical protein n=1 Tax=Dactylosporangium sp. NPDC050588 TaxID=3157211 RepID=UPI00340EE303
MIIAKSNVLAALRSRGQHDRAAWVDRSLPEDIDTARNAGLLDLLALDVASMTGKAHAAPR